MASTGAGSGGLGSSLDSEVVLRRSPAGSWESELTSVQHSLKFVLKLREEFVCPVCRGVVLNPQQNSCGHIYCFHCLHELLDTSAPSGPVCPVDGAVITPAEVFQDNCCKREISTLEVFCTNSPACTSVVALSHLQEHLRSCQHEPLPCPSPGCRAALPRGRLRDHLAAACPQCSEPCPRCRRPQPLGLVQDHVRSSCPNVEVDCPNSCSLKVPRRALAEHSLSCPEVRVQCSYRRFGCSLQDKRREMKLHEDSAVSHHMLLVMRSNADLEQQVEVLQEEALLRKQEVRADGLVLAGLQEEMLPRLQQSSSHDHVVSSVQKAADRHQDVLSAVQLDLQRVSRGLGSGLDKLEQLKRSVATVLTEASAAEALREQLGSLQESLRRHSGLLELHAAQLSHSKQHLQELEATSYDGRMIWKIQDFRKRRDAEASGRAPGLSSVPFHAGRCGYKMAAKAYLNGDGDGRGTHLSLYVVLLPGDFDALLPWPFGQTVSLSLLDQSGAGNHRSLSFRPDAASKSFRRPDADSPGNVAVGFSSFVPLERLEVPQDAAYVKDDTLFVKVTVDMTGLEQP